MPFCRQGKVTGSPPQASWSQWELLIQPWMLAGHLHPQPASHHRPQQGGSSPRRGSWGPTQYRSRATVGPAAPAPRSGSRGSALLQCSSGRSWQPSPECWGSASPSTQGIGSSEQRRCHTWARTKREASAAPLCSPLLPARLCAQADLAAQKEQKLWLCSTAEQAKHKALTKVIPESLWWR